MKARQISAAFRSVYAIDVDGRVRFIERDPEGFWTPWHDAGVSAKQIVHGGEAVARVGLDDRVSAWQRFPEPGWFTWDFAAARVTAARYPKSAPVLLASDRDHKVWYTWKLTPASPWSAWAPLDGTAEELAAAAIPGGGLAAFGTNGGAVRHWWQDAPFSAWKPGVLLDGPPSGASALSAGTLTGGGLVLFALGNDATLYHQWQDQPFGRWRDWEALGGEIESFSIAKSPGGGLAVFAIGEGGMVRHRHQAKPFGEWSAWIELRGSARQVVGQASYTDGLRCSPSIRTTRSSTPGASDSAALGPNGCLSSTRPRRSGFPRASRTPACPGSVPRTAACAGPCDHRPRTS